MVLISGSWWWKEKLLTLNPFRYRLRGDCSVGFAKLPFSHKHKSSSLVLTCFQLLPLGVEKKGISSQGPTSLSLRKHGAKMGYFWLFFAKIVFFGACSIRPVLGVWTAK
jgi:hypothetical protein